MIHSSSGIPVTPGQKGEQGVKLDTTGRMVLEGGCEAVFLILAGAGAGRPEVTGDEILEPGTTGRMETPEGREGILAVEAGGLCLPTGGCSLLSITVYFWSVLAENERVVPTLTLMATFLGTLRRTALPPAEGLTSIDTWSVKGLLFATCWPLDVFDTGGPDDTEL